MPAGSLKLMGQRVQIKDEYRKNCVKSIEDIVERI